MNTATQTPAQNLLAITEAKVLAEAKPHEKTLKSGMLVVRPCTLKELKERFGLTNKQGKRIHAQLRARWSSEMEMTIKAAFEGGYTVTRSTMKETTRQKRIGIVMVKPKTEGSMTKNETIAAQAGEIEALKAQIAKLSAKS